MAAADLEGFIGEVTGESHLRVEEDLGGGFVRLRTSEAERRQAQQDIRCSEDVVLELLRNARDAGARMICIATNREGPLRNITVIDDGEGIPRDMWQKVFEPRVTSRLDSFHDDQWGVHGRGMALFSIASNACLARVVSSGEGLGTALAVQTDVTSLGEKTDQSTIPRLIIDESGRQIVRGPRNISRIVMEFTLVQRGSCVVYLGTPNEVVATLVDYGNRVLSAFERAFAQSEEDFPVCLRPAFAATPSELAESAAGLGLSISERSARRILDGEIAPLPPFASVVTAASREQGKSPKRAPKRMKAARIHVSAEDRDEFANCVGEAYGSLARKYYLDAEVNPAVRVAQDGLHVFIPFIPADDGME